MNITSATITHAEQIAALHSASWFTTYSDVLTPTYLQLTAPLERRKIWHDRLFNPKENQIVLVAEDDEKVIGFACCYFAEHPEWGSYLDNLHVDSKHQGCGIGKQLLSKAAEFCEKRISGRGLYLLVNQSNFQAQQFYLAQGAQNSQTSIWNAPDGSTVPTFIFRWSSTATLA